MAQDKIDNIFVQGIYLKYFTKQNLISNGEKLSLIKE